jgi:CTP:molybdopterin cytidylyltransferase MocA
MAQIALQVSTRVTVVTGAYREQVEAALDGLAATPVFYPDWSQGMGGSLACGIRHLRHTHPPLASVIICLCDQPAIRAEHLVSLLAAAEAAPARIAAAQYADGTLGVPALFPADVFGELEALQGAQGARGLLARHAGAVVPVPMPAAGIDIDTPADYRQWLSGDASRNHIQPAS